jgi:group I intron endonuclease
MSLTVFIYGLVDPFTNQLKYIGKSVNPTIRLRKHISERNKRDSHKDRWIRKIINKGIKPELIIIDEVSQSNWGYWEKYYISYFRFIGCTLTNGTSGGDQPPSTKGRKHTEESKRKMSETKKGNPIPWLNNGLPRSITHRENLSKACSGRMSPNKGKKYSEELCDKLVKASTSNKPVLQLDLNNNLIKEWSSKSLAERTLKIRHISECCRNIKNYKTSGGFKWVYKNE